MELDIREYVRDSLLQICTDRELSIEDTTKVTEDEIDSILYIVENRLDSAIMEMFEEVMDE